MKKPGLFRFFTSMKLATVLIAAIIIACLLGSIIPQNAGYTEYVDSYGPLVADVISSTAADHVFSSVWFFAVLAVFFVNLSCCTASRFIWAAKIYKKTGDRLVLVGSPLFHLGICIVFVGVLISLIFGRKYYYELAVGESKTLSEFSTPISITVEDFRMEYYDNNIDPKQYISTLNISEEDGSATQLVTSVNSPGSYRGISFLQQSYGWEVSVSVFTDKAKREYRIREEQWIPLSDEGENGISLGVAFYPDYKEEGENLRMDGRDANPRVLWVLRYGQEPVAMGTLSKGQSDSIMDQLGISFDDYRNYTGLQLKNDKGINIIFVGFFVACLGICLRYLPRKKSEQKFVEK